MVTHGGPTISPLTFAWSPKKSTSPKGKQINPRKEGKPDLRKSPGSCAVVDSAHRQRARRERRLLRPESGRVLTQTTSSCSQTLGERHRLPNAPPPPSRTEEPLHFSPARRKNHFLSKSGNTAQRRTMTRGRLPLLPSAGGSGALKVKWLEEKQKKQSE